MITPKNTPADPTGGGEIHICDPSKSVITVSKSHTNTGNGATPEQSSLLEGKST